MPSTLITVTIPEDQKKTINSFLKEPDKDKAAVLEVWIQLKDGEEMTRRLKTLQIIFHRPGPETFGSFFVSNTGKIMKSIKTWEDIMIPELNLWQSIIMLIKETIIRGARGDKRSIKELAIVFQNAMIVSRSSLHPKAFSENKTPFLIDHSERTEG